MKSVGMFTAGSKDHLKDARWRYFHFPIANQGALNLISYPPENDSFESNTSKLLNWCFPISLNSITTCQSPNHQPQHLTRKSPPPPDESPQIILVSLFTQLTEFLGIPLLRDGFPSIMKYLCTRHCGYSLKSAECQVLSV